MSNPIAIDGRSTGVTKLRLVVFTSGPLTPVNRAFFERLANDPLLDLAAIVIDEYQPKRKPLARRIVRAVREDGPAWFAFKIESRLRSSLTTAAFRLADWIHRPRLEESDVTLLEESYVTLSARTGAAIHRVADIHSAESVALIRSLSTDLGVIVGTRILRDAVITVPKYGTLNIHKRKVPEYRGGGPVGYWEILAGERSVGVTIHFATSQLDAGPVLAQDTIEIEPCDTLESLAIKADLRGAQLYHQTLRQFAEGRREGTPQVLSHGTTYRSPSEYKVWRLQRRLRRQAEKAMGLRRRSFLKWTRLLIQYGAVLPHLRTVKRTLIREKRAPVTFFFYHLVTNAARNDMCHSLPVFVRQIEFLRRYFPVLSLDRAIERLRSGENDEVAASITFDDGYRDNTWAIEYLRYLGIPATFFVSVGHVREGTGFRHDEYRGHHAAPPMSPSDVRQLANDGFTIGSHALYHEDFGSLPPATADEVLQKSRALLEQLCGASIDTFAFPTGQRGTNITPESFELALKHYRYIFSAYGGYSLPEPRRRHFLRICAPYTAFELAQVMSGYTGFRQTLRGDAWGRKIETLDPCATDRKKRADRLTVALVAASPRIVGGHSVQAQALAENLRAAGREVMFLPIDPALPGPMRWIRRVPYLRTIVNQALYIPGLARILRADIVHVFSASYWSFLLAPAPAMIAGALLRKPVVLHYHSGEADDHLRRWRPIVAPILRLAHKIVVPSEYLRKVFASHGYRAEVIHNAIDPAAFRHRERSPLRPVLLSTRNLESYYDVENTVAAFALVKERFPSATLCVAGFGSHDQAVRQLADALGVADSIQFLGCIDPATLPAICDSADIFLNSSVLDNQPVSILEAFAAGLPVVSTPTGDIAAMLEQGKAGLLVPPRDPEAMAAAVIRLLEHPEDALQLSRRGRQQLERYSWPSVRNQWLNLYAELLTGRSAVAPTEDVTAASLASHV